MNEITYHVGSHKVKAELKHFLETESHGEFCAMDITFNTTEGVVVSSIVMIINGDEIDAKTVLSSIKAVL